MRLQPPFVCVPVRTLVCSTGCDIFLHISHVPLACPARQLYIKGGTRPRMRF